MTAQRITGQRGVVTLELIGYYAVVMFVVVAVLQLFVAGYAAVEATNAARAGARTASLGGGGGAAEAAATEALAPGLLDGATVGVEGGQATVQVDVPSLFGGASIATLTRTAEMPETSEPVDLGAGAITAGGPAGQPPSVRPAGTETRS